MGQSMSESTAELSFILFNGTAGSPEYIDVFDSKEELVKAAEKLKHDCVGLVIPTPPEISKLCFEFVVKVMSDMDDAWKVGVQDGII
tara:strand:- start:423 stop:683 length:261 start_codon:yes stop_codon:yes gene_type:complete